MQVGAEGAPFFQPQLLLQKTRKGWTVSLAHSCWFLVPPTETRGAWWPAAPEESSPALCPLCLYLMPCWSQRAESAAAVPHTQACRGEAAALNPKANNTVGLGSILPSRQVSEAALLLAPVFIRMEGVGKDEPPDVGSLEKASCLRKLRRRCGLTGCARRCIPSPFWKRVYW